MEMISKTMGTVFIAVILITFGFVLDLFGVLPTTPKLNQLMMGPLLLTAVAMGFARICLIPWVAWILGWMWKIVIGLGEGASAILLFCMIWKYPVPFTSQQAYATIVVMGLVGILMDRLSTKSYKELKTAQDAETESSDGGEQPA